LCKENQNQIKNPKQKKKINLLLKAPEVKNGIGKTNLPVLLVFLN